jgi:hypothetical protein
MKEINMKTTLARLAAVAAACVLFAFRAPAAESLSTLLQRGIYAEETEGNLDSAIKIYEQIAAEAASSRDLVTQAQFRLAVCYQKKGSRAAAVRTLNELLQRADADSSVAKRARDSLADLGQTAPAGVGIRQVAIPGASNIWSGDGRYIAFAPAKPNDSDLALLETATGKHWIVEKASGETGTWAGLRISPDGQWIAYDREEQTKIRLARIDASEIKTLFERPGGKDHDYLDVMSWSKDGRQVIVRLSNAKTNALLAIDVATGNSKELFRAPAGGDDWWDLSSDLRYLARCRGRDPRSITIIDFQTGKEEVIVDRDANRVFDWLADDSAIVYTKYSKRGTELWVHGVKEGKSDGEPQLIWNNFANIGEVLPRGIGLNGNIYYHVRGGEAAGTWVMEGFLSRAMAALKSPAPHPEVAIPLSEVTGPDKSFIDRKVNVSFTPPANLTVRSAMLRGNGATNVAMRFASPIDGASNVTIAYRSMAPWDNSVFSVFPLKELAPPPTSPAEIDPWMRSFARSMERQRIERNLANYKNRSPALRRINDNPALSWAGDYIEDGVAKTEYFTVIFGKTAVAWSWFQAPTAKIEEARPVLEQLLQSVKLP